MKKLIILLGLHFVFSSLHAQSSEKNDFFYLTGELAFGNYTEVNFNLNGIINEKYSLELGYSGHMRRAKSEPDDYSSGLLSGIITLGFSEFNFDYMENYQILFGKIFPLDEKGQIRLNLAGGIGYTVIKEPTNWQRVDDSEGLGPNYTFDTEKHSTVSLIINPRFEFPLSPVIGITLYPMLQINKDRTFFGIGAGLMLGYLRKKDKSDAALKSF